MKSLTRKDALLLLPAVVDGEAEENEISAFLEFIENHPDIKKEYESALMVKEILKSILPKHTAPEHLKIRILEELEHFADSKSYREKTKITPGLKNKAPLFHHAPLPVRKYTGITLRYLAAAAVILFISLVTLQLLDRTTHKQTVPQNRIVENMAAEHFLTSGGRILDPFPGTETIREAEIYLSEHFGLAITVPPIENAEFAGIVMTDFIENFQAPLLEYVQTAPRETIYIFVFDIDDISTHEQLERMTGAVESCIYDHDFYVTEINGHHVVSWMWGNYWYTAISNHNGYDLAALVPALNP